jgi:hypothetical protein
VTDEMVEKEYSKKEVRSSSFVIKELWQLKKFIEDKSALTNTKDDASYSLKMSSKRQ